MRRSGFSMIELSIVLVVLGLLAGAILAGQSLVAASQLNNIASAYGKYQIAYNGFKTQYNAIPGDMPNASSVLGGSAVNGNGNGLIGDAGVDSMQYVEPPAAWQHLALAGLIPGSYTGVYGASAADWVAADVNFPSIKAKSSGHLFAMGGGSGGVPGVALIPTLQGEMAPNVLFIGIDIDAQYWPVQNCKGGQSGCLYADDVERLDRKLDDGLPCTGNAYVNMAHTYCVRTSGFVDSYCTPGVVQNAYRSEATEGSSYTSICSLSLVLD